MRNGLICGVCRGGVTEAGWCRSCKEYVCPYCFDPMESPVNIGDFRYCRRCDVDFVMRVVRYVDGEPEVVMPRAD